MLEGLETRSTPAVTYTWTGAGNGNWSDPNDWVDANNNHAVPTANDDVVFNSTGNSLSTVDTGFGGTIHNVTIQSGYTQDLWLSRALTVTGTLSQSDGAIDGSADLNIPSQGVYNWSGGKITGITGMGGAPNVNIAANGVLNLQGTADKTLNLRTIKNSGTTNWTSGKFVLQNGGEFDNQSQAVFNSSITSSASIDGTADASGTLFLNEASATFNQTTNDVASLWVRFTNNGTVNGQSGEIIFDANSNSSGGTFTAGATDSITFASTCTLSMGIGTTTINGTGNAKLDGGTISGSGTLEISGTLNVNSGVIGAMGTLTIDANKQLNCEGNSSILIRTVNNSGTITCTGSNLTLNGSTINNNSGAIFDIQASMNLGANGGNTAAFTNNGTLKMSAGTLAVLNFTTFTQSGTLQINTGTLEITEDFSQSGGTTQLNGGNLQVDGTFTVQHGSNLTLMVSSGTIYADAVVNHGTISMGSSPGTLTISGVSGRANSNGNYTQGADGTLSLKITGNNNACDKLVITTGQAQLGGTLNVSLASGYTPSGGAQAWTLLTYGSNPNNSTFDPDSINGTCLAGPAWKKPWFSQCPGR
jgi:adhesin HecA-like repeat protein